MNCEEKCSNLASFLHRGQIRRNGRAYIEHCRDVADFFDSPIYRSVAWLHDVIENCDIDAEGLISRGISRVVVDAVEFLTKKDNSDYETYLRDLVGNEIAIGVKIADMICNVSDDPTSEQIVKYRRGLSYLLEFKKIRS